MGRHVWKACWPITWHAGRLIHVPMQVDSVLASIGHLEPAQARVQSVLTYADMCVGMGTDMRQPARDMSPHMASTSALQLNLQHFCTHANPSFNRHGHTHVNARVGTCVHTDVYTQAADELSRLLTYRTFLVGHCITIADLVCV